MEYFKIALLAVVLIAIVCAQQTPNDDLEMAGTGLKKPHGGAGHYGGGGYGSSGGYEKGKKPKPHKPKPHKPKGYKPHKPKGHTKGHNSGFMADYHAHVQGGYGGY